MRASKVLICAALLLSLPMMAAADERANAPTVTGETGLFTLFSGQTLPQGGWSFGVYYNNWDRVLEDAGDSDVDWNRLSASVGYGITENFEISASVPYDDFDFDFDNDFFDDEFFGDDDFDDSASGIGNARLNAKWRLFQEVDSAFALNAFVELPTGDEDALGGDTGFGVGADWSTGNWVLNLGWRSPGSDELDLSDEVVAGIGYAGRVSDNFDWITELVGTLPIDSDDALFEESVDLTTGGRYWFGDGGAGAGGWALNFALRTDLLQLSDTDEHCPLGGLLGLTYFPAFFAQPEEEVPVVLAPVDYVLTVETRGDCEGTVTSSPAGVDCGADCSEIYAEGTVVNLTATPAPDCVFDGWTGDADCRDGSVTMNGDRFCIANFSDVPPPVAPVAPPAPEVTEVTILFPAGARLDNIAKARLDEVALQLKQEPDATARVIGYSDSTGSEQANLRISRERAEAVKNYLVTRHGIDPSRITTEGRGSAEPVGDNTTAQGRRENRRAVVIVTVP
ncbi:MAG TPA: OmpA family protein [Thermoanaerobaculia bacterium]|nr:OmpA family protein [Thermoanaerobaculia bacterium]